MKCHQVVFICRFNTFCKCIPNRKIVRIAVDALSARPVAPVYPDNIRKVFVPVPQVFSVCKSVINIEYYWSRPPGPVNLIAPGREQSYKNAFGCGKSDHTIYKSKVAFIWFERIIINKRSVTISIGCIQTVEFRKNYGLYDSEAFHSAVLKIFFCFGETQPVK